jgi:hypothetical protein
MNTTTKKTKGPEFGTVDKVQEAIGRMQTVEEKRGLDRSRINTLFNGALPYTPEEEKKYQIAINVNFGMGKRIMLDANRQLNNALLHPGTLFTCSTDSGPVAKRDEWGQDFTAEIQKPLQRGKSGKRNMFLIKNRNASVCMHGIGPLLWPNDFRWMPRFVPLEDLLIPSDTYCDFSNIRYFAVNLYLSPGEFTDMTQGDMTQKGWNKASCAKLLQSQKDYPNESMPSDWQDRPEAFWETFKQNQGFYYSDAIDKIRLRAFYFQSVDEPKQWFRRVVPRESTGVISVDAFLYTSDEVFATDIDQILNVQYGDGSLVAPHKYHSVRGLGVDLYSPVEITNRMQCEFAQSTFEHLKMYFRIQNPADRDRLKQVVLQQFGFIPEGLQIVGRNDRHQIDPNMVEMVLAQMRQFMQENSSAFVQDTADASGKEMTAKEATIRLNQANVMIGSMLQMMYIQEGFYYEELVRRFCKTDSADPEVKAFHNRCLARGIPKEMINAEKWRVSPERVLGGGDQTLADAQAQWLYQNRTSYNPESQNKIMRLVTSTILRDNDKAKAFVPDAPATSSKGSEMSEQLFGTLMLGIECSMRQGIDFEGYIVKMLVASQGVIQRIGQSGNMATMPEVIGLGTVLQNVEQYVAALEKDDAKKQFVKQIRDVMGQQMNELKGFAQRLQEEQDANQDPEGMAKIQTMVMAAQTKAKISEATAAQKMQHKEAAFSQKQGQAQAAHGLNLRKESLSTEQLLATNQAKTVTELQAEQLKTKQAIATEQAKTMSQIESDKLKAKNAPKTTSQ